MEDQLLLGRWLQQLCKALDLPQPEFAPCIKCTLANTQVGGIVEQTAKRLIDLLFMMGQATQHHELLSPSFDARHFVFAGHDRSLIPTLISICIAISELNKAW